MADEELRQGERKLLSQVSEWLYSAKSMGELLMVVSKSLETLLPEAEGQLFIYANSRDMLDLRAKWGGAGGPDHIEADECWSLRRGRAYAFGGRAIEFPCAHVTCQDTPYFCLPVIAQGDTIGLLHLAFTGLDPISTGKGHVKELLDRRWELALLCAEQISLAVANVQLRQELLDQSVRDPLTGLWNRRWFLDAALKEMKRAGRTGSDVSLVSLDVDHFKRFNDHHGHDAGDIVLREVGALMRQLMPHPLAPCRLGGEEFVILCPGLTHDETLARAESFRGGRRRARGSLCAGHVAGDQHIGRRGEPFRWHLPRGGHVEIRRSGALCSQGRRTQPGGLGSRPAARRRKRVGRAQARPPRARPQTHLPIARRALLRPPRRPAP